MKDVFLITGATGFVGSCLTQRLVKLNKNVHIISRNPQENWRIRNVYKTLDVHKIDLLDDKLPILIKKIKPTYVFHLAAYGSLPHEKDFAKMMKTNVLGTANLINSIKGTDFKLFINTGSSSEYKYNGKPLKENDLVGPTNDYGVSKTAQTLYCQKEAILNNLPIITFRLFSPFGHYEDKTRLIPHIILNALENRNIPLSNPNFVRDFVFIEDVIDLYIKACKIEPKTGEIFNVGSSKQQSIKNVVKTVLSITNSKSRPIWGKIEKQTRQIEPKIWEANIVKTTKTFGWKPKYSLEFGLRETILWFERNQDLYA